MYQLSEILPIWNKLVVSLNWESLCILFFILLMSCYHLVPLMRNIPPGPLPWPIFGNLFQTDSLPHVGLAKLSQKYGPVMSLWLGSKLSVVISSASAAEEFYKFADEACASRPLTKATEILTHGGKDIAFAPYGDEFKKLKRITTIHLLSAKQMKTSENVRISEVSRMINAIEVEMEEGTRTVKIKEFLSRATLNNILLLISGKRFEYSLTSRKDKSADDLASAIRESFDLLGAFKLGDYIPFFSLFDPQNISSRCKVNERVLCEFCGNLIEEHKSKKMLKSEIMEESDQEHDFIDTLLDLKGEDELDSETMVAVLQDLVLGGVDTSAVVSEWILTELVLHPEIQEKLRNELKDSQDQNFKNCKYLQAVVNEGLRLHMPGPLMVPHLARKSTNLGGFQIPAGSTVFINSWAIAHDPSNWNDPFQFNPERFMGSTEVNVKGRDYRILPFGSGRRGCLGMLLGLEMVTLMVFKMVSSFKMELPKRENGAVTDVNMEEKWGLTVSMKDPLIVKLSKIE